MDDGFPVPEFLKRGQKEKSTGQRPTSPIHRERRRGVVKFFDRGSGYGFIVPEGGGNDIFFAADDVEWAGREKVFPERQRQRVTYCIGRDVKRNKPKAVQIVLLL